jgi:hypothetical protein
MTQEAELLGKQRLKTDYRKKPFDFYKNRVGGSSCFK